MALSNAANLANLASGDALTIDNTNDRVGIASTSPTVTLDVAGIVSATSYYGDGSNLEGVASAGLGTAISETPPADVIYYTNTSLSIGSTLTIDAPSSSNVAYTQYAEIEVLDDADLIIADGDDFIPDVLGLTTEGSSNTGTGGRVRADSYVNRAGTGAPTFPNGVVVSSAATFSSNVSIAGTLTYEDVTNVDAIGVITARSGIRVGAGQSIGSDGAAVVYYGDGANLTNVGSASSTITLQTWLFGGG